VAAILPERIHFKTVLGVTEQRAAASPVVKCAFVSFEDNLVSFSLDIEYIDIIDYIDIIKLFDRRTRVKEKIAYNGAV